MVVKHDSGHASRLEYAPGLLQTTRRVGTVVHDSVRINDIERVVRKGEALGVSLVEVWPEAGQFTPITVRNDSIVCRVDTVQWSLFKYEYPVLV